nr:hypothetical protein [uncultured Flavobacterium sp.]
MNIEDVKKELNEYVGKNPDIVAKAFYNAEVVLNKHCKTITAVKGKFPSFYSIIGHVIQPFAPAWNEIGEASFKHKMLQNHRMKVNFPILADEVLNTWLADLYIEGKKAEEHPVSKHIMDDLLAKVVDDIDILSQTGNTSSTDAFLKSCNGVSRAVSVGLANTSHPMFKIPLTAITTANILDQIKKYEKSLPKATRKKVKKLYMSTNLALEFQDQYEQTYGTKVTYTDGDAFRTPLSKLEIVPLDHIADNVIFSTVEGNLVRLIDVFDKPEVTDIQKQDYKLKIFMDGHLGYDFLINELVYVAVFDGSVKGLNNANLNTLLYPGENLTVAQQG